MTDVINLEKGQKITLEKVAPSTKVFKAALGWPEGDFDLDASAFLLKYDAKGEAVLVDPPGFIFFNRTRSDCGGVVHSGDNLTGIGDGDDETITIDFNLLDPKYDQIDIWVTIFDAVAKGQNFGQVSRKGPVFVRLDDGVSNSRLANYDFSDDDASVATALLFASLYKEAGNWKFQAVGLPKKADLQHIIHSYNPAMAVAGHG